MHTRKAAHAPAAHNFIHPARRSRAKSPSAPKRQIVDEGSVKVLGHIEVGVVAAFPRPQLVADETIPAEGHLVCDQGDVVDGVRPRVVQIKGQPVGEVLMQSYQQTVVAGGSLIGVERVLRELSAHTNIWRQTEAIGLERRESLRRIRKITSCRVRAESLRDYVSVVRET